MARQVVVCIITPKAVAGTGSVFSAALTTALSLERELGLVGPKSIVGAYAISVGFARKMDDVEEIRNLYNMRRSKITLLALFFGIAQMASAVILLIFGW